MSSSLPNGHNYELLSYDEEHDITSNQEPPKAKRTIPILWRLELLIRKYPKAFFMSLLISTFLIYALSTWPFLRLSRTMDCDNIEDGFQCEPDISHYWGQYSPFFSVPSEIPSKTPERCEITFVQVLSRHGARDPTKSKSMMYSTLIDSIQTVVDKFSGKYAFMKEYRYSLGSDQLTSFGQQHMYNSGAKFFDRYKDLALAYTPFVRASGQTRVIDSAHLFSQGYHEACFNNTKESSANCNGWPYPYTEIPETAGSHNPLDQGLCDAFEESHRIGDWKQGQDAFRDIFAKPITTRLNKDLPGADLDNDDTVLIMDLCPFETVAHPDGKLSPFCSLFTQSEWKQYDYYQTLGKFYGFASPNGLGPTQGVGFTNELIARLTEQPVQDHTSVDHDLDGDAKTFPLGKEWKIFADFSHDNNMIAIMAAMGIFSETTMLSNDTIQDGLTTKGFSASWLAPFASRVYIEKMNCKIDSVSEGEDYVRILVNDRVQTMKSCGADELGRCKLSNFLDSLSFAKRGGRWDEC